MNLDRYDLSKWEKDILIEFDKIKPLEEILFFVTIETDNDFLINLADGLNEFKSKLKLE